MQWDRIALSLSASTAAKGAYDTSLKSFFSSTFALHLCFVLNSTSRAHASVSHSGGWKGLTHQMWEVPLHHGSIVYQDS